MNPEKFNPTNPEYKRVEDLPQEHHESFVNIEGGFVKKDAKKELIAADGRAKQQNVGRTFLNRMFTGSETGLSVLHQDALSEQQYREEMGVRISKIIREKFALPNVSSDELKSILDEGLEDFRRGGIYGLGSLVSRGQEAEILNEIERRKQQEDPSFEKFNPNNLEHKKVEDLPQEHQANFVDVVGGFVRREAAEGRHVKQAEFYAEDLNSMRSLWDRIRGKNKLTALDELQRSAAVDDMYRDVGIAEIDEVIKSRLAQPNVSSRDIEQLLEYI